MMTNIVHFFVITMTIVKCSACPIMCVCHNNTNLLPENINTLCDHTPTESKHLNSTRCLEVNNLNETEVKYFVEDLLVNKARPTCQTQLRLVYSVIPDNITFANLELIETLDLPENQIESLQEIIFDLPSLNRLDLSRNSLETINNRPFKLLKNLKYLNLSSNSIFNISSDSFQKLTMLVNLDLARNNLKSLNDGMFQQVTSLQFLNISYNNFQALNESSFRNLLELQELDISFNRLVQISSAINLPSLAVLNLDGNPELGISEEPYLFLISGGHLQIVDASYIGLKQIPAALTISIRFLQLSGNSINTIRRGDFDSYPLLQVLDLTSNGLSSIEYDALGRLNYLTQLHLKNNSLNELPKSLPENLKLLDLQSNNIQRVSVKDLEGLHHLEILLLKNNKITTIRSETFNNLEGLKSLDISSNPIIILENFFWSLKKLKTLKMSHIVFSNSSVQQLDSFRHMENLIYLDLSGSPQLASEFLEAKILNHSRKIEDLNLSNASIINLPNYLLFYLPKLHILHLEGNKLDCSKLQWLAAWMYKNSPLENIKSLKCSSPPELSGMLLINLTKNLMNSKSSSAVHQVNISRPTDNSKNLYPEIRSQNLFSTIINDKVTSSVFNKSSKHNSISPKDLFLNSESDSPETKRTEWNEADKITAPSSETENKLIKIFHSKFLIVVEIFTMIILVIGLVLVKVVRKRKFKVLDQQDEEMVNSSSVIELW